MPGSKEPGHQQISYWPCFPKFQFNELIWYFFFPTQPFVFEWFFIWFCQQNFPLVRIHLSCRISDTPISDPGDWCLECVIGQKHPSIKTWGCQLPDFSQTVLGERQPPKSALFKEFNTPLPYTLSLQCSAYSKLSQLSYEPGCSRELWCRKCATQLWNTYVLNFSKTLFYTHIQRHTATAGTNCN